MSKTNPFAPQPDPVLREIKGSVSLEELADTYVEHHAAWTSAHTLAAMTRLSEILATERMIADERDYQDY